VIDDGHDVLCVDNSDTGRKEQRRHLAGHKRFELIRQTAGCRSVEVDRIYN